MSENYYFHREGYYLEGLVQRLTSENIELRKINSRLEDALKQIMSNSDTLQAHDVWKICVNALYPKGDSNDFV